MNLDKYFELLRNTGADTAIEIAVSDIVVANWPIIKCRYGCPNFGHNRACPPFAPEAEETRRILSDYSRAILFSSPQMDAVTPSALSCTKSLLADGFYRAVAFGAGPCRRCEKCTPHNCPSPMEVAPSPEACGIDVVATVRAVGLPISMPPKPGDQLHCYGLVLVE